MLVNESFARDVGLSLYVKESNVWSHPRPRLGMFWRILQHCIIGHFSYFGSYLWKNWSNVYKKILFKTCLWTSKFTSNFGSQPDPNFRSCGLRILIRLAEVCFCFLHVPWFIDSRSVAVSYCLCRYSVVALDFQVCFWSVVKTSKLNVLWRYDSAVQMNK